MFCQNCGKEVSTDSEFCISCGANLKHGRVASDITDKVKTASRDALSAFKIFAVNPVGGLSAAFESTDKDRALYSGIFLAFAYDVLVFFGMYLGMKKLGGGFGMFIGDPSFGEFKIGDALKILIFGAVPPISIAIVSFLSRKIFHGTDSYEGDVFIAGAALLPLGIFLFMTGLLGIANFEVLAILFVFAICYAILILYSGCTKISKISEGSAALAVPIMLLLGAWFSKIIWTSLM